MKKTLISKTTLMTSRPPTGLTGTGNSAYILLDTEKQDPISGNNNKQIRLMYPVQKNIFRMSKIDFQKI